MALLNFPTPIAIGDQTTQNGNTWQWNGTSWVAFNNLSLSSQVTGVLGTLYGGTGKALSSITVGSLLYADTSSSFTTLAPSSTSAYVLASAGAGNPPYWKIDDSGTGSVGSGNTFGFTYYNGLNTVTSGTAFSYIVGPGSGGTGGTVILTSSTMALIGSTITSGTWAGSAITLTYGGTNGTNSGIALSNQIAVYNNAGMAITQILSSSGTANSILLQASQNVTPQWVSQSSLLVGSASTAAAVVTDSSTSLRYLVGTITNSGSANTTLSTGSGITFTDNRLTSHTLVALGSSSSISTSTGALIVAGGVGIGGSLWTSVNNFSSISGVGHSNSTITSGTQAGNAVTLTYGGTNNNISGIGYSYQIAVYNNAGNAITQIFSSSGTANSILLQPSQDAYPRWVSQSTLVVGGATTAGSASTAAAVVTDSSTSLRYLVGTITNSGSANTTLSTGSGITFTDNRLTSHTLVALGSSASISTSTGALIVAGGVGIGGSLWTATTNYASISGLGISNGQVISGVWGGFAVSLVNGGTGNNISGSGHSNRIAIYNTSGTAISGLVMNRGDIIIGSIGGTYAAIGASLTPTAYVSTTPPPQPGLGIGNTQQGQLWWDSTYGVLKIYYADTDTSQWVDATPVLGSSGGGSSTKRSYVMTFGAGFTPSVGADSVQIQVPYAPDNTSKYYFIKRLDYRNETVSGSTGASFFIDRHTAGAVAFSAANRIHTAGAGAASSFVIGAATYASSWTLAATGASFVSSSGVAASVISGDYLRLNFTTVNSAATLSVSIIIEEQ